MTTIDPRLSVDAPFYANGEFLPSKAARLQEVLQDYNRFLELVYIPSSQRTDTDTHPFAILDSSPWRLGPGGQGQIIKHITEREIEDPAAVLAWLFEGDLSKHSAQQIFDRELLKKQAQELLDRKRDMEIAEERQELIAALATGGRDKKHYYRHNGKTFRQ